MTRHAKTKMDADSYLCIILFFKKGEMFILRHINLVAFCQVFWRYVYKTCIHRHRRNYFYCNQLSTDVNILLQLLLLQNFKLLKILEIQGIFLIYNFNFCESAFWMVEEKPNPLQKQDKNIFNFVSIKYKI